MKTETVVWVVIACVCVVVGVLTPTPTAQEKPVREMRHWQLGWLPGVDNTKTSNVNMRGRVDVYDTEGTCLYVVQGYHRVEESSGAIETKAMAIGLGFGVAIAAVPKTQLPKGAGCQ